MIKTDKIPFSIILPTFNREKKLEIAINSVIKQTYEHWELIIIDNKSSDKTKDLVNSYKNKKISFYEIENEGVIAKSRNLGIEKSKGEYLCFLDSDDWWHNEKLECISKILNKNYSFIYHNHLINSPNSFIKKRKINSINLSNSIFSSLINFGPSFATSSVTVKKDIFKKIGCFDTDRKYIAWEDFDAWIRLSKITNNFYKIDKSLSIINIDDANFLDDKLKIKNTYLFLDKYLKDHIKIPNWCLYNILVAEYNLSNFKEVKKILNKIIFFELNLKKKINFIRIFFLTFFK